MAAAVGAVVSLAAARGHAQSFVERVSAGACDHAGSFELDDDSPAAKQAWRACRLERFERKLTVERHAEVAAETQAHEARIREWLEATQPVRVVRPMAVEAFAGIGIPNYGVGFSWFVLRRLELGARIGWRENSYAEPVSTRGMARYTARTIGGGARWLVTDKDFSPFVGVGFAVTGADVDVTAFNQEQMGFSALFGVARAHSSSASAGLQAAIRSVRVSVEYVYEYVFYTGANLADAQKTPSEDIRLVWRDSLTKDRHGIRVQVGYAF